MPAHAPQQDPNHASGEETTDALGVVIFNTGLRTRVNHVGPVLKGSTGIGDEFIPKWDQPDPGQPGMVRVRYFKASGAAADTAVTFSWHAMGF